ncbi:MAG: 30S ribosomal protein S4 [Thermoproteota archaeon]
MGDPKKQKSKLVKPRHPWAKELLQEELSLIGEFGLRNKRELYRAGSLLRKFRSAARTYMTLSTEARASKERELISSLYRLGILEENATLDDVLSLRVSDILSRRLQTLVFRKGFANSIHQARQLICHGKVLVGNVKVRSPSFLVRRVEEPTISVVK